MIKPIRILVVGCGHMGISHARAYHQLPGFEICGLVSRGPASRGKLNAEFGNVYPEYSDVETAIRESKPDAVSINTYPDTHAKFAIRNARKDLRYYTNMTETMPISSPIAETIHQTYVLADTMGYGERYVPRLIDMMIKNSGGKS